MENAAQQRYACWLPLLLPLRRARRCSLATHLACSPLLLRTAICPPPACLCTTACGLATVGPRTDVPPLSAPCLYQYASPLPPKLACTLPPWLEFSCRLLASAMASVFHRSACLYTTHWLTIAPLLCQTPGAPQRISFPPGVALLSLASLNLLQAPNWLPPHSPRILSCLGGLSTFPAHFMLVPNPCRHASFPPLPLSSGRRSGPNPAVPVADPTPVTTAIWRKGKR